MRVFIADDWPKVRSALRLLLEQDPEMSVVGEATEAEGLLAQVSAIRPDLVLIDWELPGLQAANLSTGATRTEPVPSQVEGSKRSGHHLLPTLRALCPRLSVIALSGRPEARRAALAAGVDAFVSKGDPPDRLLEAVNDCRGDPIHDGGCL